MRIFEIQASNGQGSVVRKVTEDQVPAQVRALLELGYFYFVIDEETV